MDNMKFLTFQKLLHFLSIVNLFLISHLPIAFYFFHAPLIQKVGFQDFHSLNIFFFLSLYLYLPTFPLVLSQSFLYYFLQLQAFFQIPPILLKEGLFCLIQIYIQLLSPFYLLFLFLFQTIYFFFLKAVIHYFLFYFQKLLFLHQFLNLIFPMNLFLFHIKDTLLLSFLTLFF